MRAPEQAVKYTDFLNAESFCLIQPPWLGTTPTGPVRGLSGVAEGIPKLHRRRNTMGPDPPAPRSAKRCRAGRGTRCHTASAPCTDSYRMTPTQNSQTSRAGLPHEQAALHPRTMRRDSAATCESQGHLEQHVSIVLGFGHRHRRKVGFVRIDGSTAAQSRSGLVAGFQNDPACRVAVLSISAAGAGLTLTVSSFVNKQKLMISKSGSLGG